MCEFPMLFINNQELGRECMLIFFKEILKNFDSLRKKWISSTLRMAAIIELCMAVIMAYFCGSMFIAACFCTSGVMLGGMADVVRVVPASGNRVIRLSPQHKHVVHIDMCSEILRPRARSHSRTRRSATHSSSVDVGGNADDGDGSSDSSDSSSPFRFNSNSYLKYFQKTKTYSFFSSGLKIGSGYCCVFSCGSTWEVAL